MQLAVVVVVVAVLLKPVVRQTAADQLIAVVEQVLASALDIELTLAELAPALGMLQAPAVFE